MGIIKNPFRFLASDSIDSDLNFLRWFGPDVLDAIDPGSLWSMPVIFRSSPGAGKTSLLRVFTPDSLLSICQSRKEKDLDKLFLILKKYGVVDKDKPLCLGVMISCMKGFAQIEDLILEPLIKERLFLALLNARMAIAFLRNATKLFHTEFPYRVDHITFSTPEKHPTGFEEINNGQQLLEWARTQEESICALLDSFNPKWSQKLHGSEPFPILSILSADNVLYNNQPFVSKILFMFDDVHGLTDSQRKSILEHVITNRTKCVWFAERLEALSSRDALSIGATENRDFKSISLEVIYRNQKKRHSFFEDIASRRIRTIVDITLPDFSSCLSERLDEDYYRLKIDECYEDVMVNINSYTSKTSRYDVLLQEHAFKELSGLDKYLDLKKVEILILRDIGKTRQLSFFDEALDFSEINQSDKKSLLDAAHIMLTNKSDIPFYYSSDKIIKFASNNILQFLSICAELFEELISQALQKKQTLLTAKDQHRIVSNFVLKKWKEIGTSAPSSKTVQLFLRSIGHYLKENTLKSTAPYPPGTTGVGLAIEEYSKICDSTTDSKFKNYSLVLHTLATCVKLNYLEYREIIQNNRQWIVLYLNRWLCAYFKLPFTYGGWRPVTAMELLSGCENGQLRVVKGKL